MTARDYAINDMLPELEKKNKSFLAFRSKLNPIMRKLVRDQLKQQKDLSNFWKTSPSHSNSQLMARCFFCKSEVHLSDYSKYYEV